MGAEVKKNQLNELDKYMIIDNGEDTFILQYQDFQK